MVPTRATTPEPICCLMSSASPLRSFAGTPSSTRGANFTPPISLTSGPPLAAPPPVASLRRNSEISRSMARRSSRMAEMRDGTSVGATFSVAAAVPSRFSRSAM